MSVLGQGMSLGFGTSPGAVCIADSKIALGDCTCVHVPPNDSELCAQVVPGRLCCSKLYPV